jgi:Protein of unknown function (DUF3105)
MTVKTRTTRAARRSDWAQQEERRRRLWILFGVLAAVAFVAMLGYLIYQQSQPLPHPGHDVPIQGRNHIPVGQPHDPYNSEPPSSGPHYDTPAQAGFYDQAPVDEYLVHSMEHGYVIIWYNCDQYTAGTCDQLKTQIKDVMGAAGVSAVTGTLKLIAVPRAGQKTAIALSAWGHIDTPATYNRQEILDFIRAYRDGAFAPEPGLP